jgi:predicted nucleic acid-binding protein
MPQLVVAIDANVLIASLLVSTGACRRLMEFASLGIFRPVITSEVLAEAERHCRKGVRGRVVTNAEIQALRAAVYPLLEAEELASSPVGRAASENAPLVNIDNRVILQPHPGGTGHPRGLQKRTEMIDEHQAFIRDMGDAHVFAAAIRHRCDYVCTGNTRDFPADFEMNGLRFCTPNQLLLILLKEDDEGPWD